MRALVTGAGGFVGPHLVRHLIDAGDTVVDLDVASGPDLRDREGWADVMAERLPDVVYHLAGWSDVGGSWNEPWTTFEVNVMGTVALLEAIRLAGGAKVILVSSADVYGLVNERDLPLTEAHPVQPRSPYGASKVAAEDIASAYWRGHDLPIIVARPFNHLGKGQAAKFAAASFARQIARLEADGGGTLTHGDLSTRRDLTDVHDVVRAYRLLALHGEPGETYNICSGTAVSMQQMLDTLLDLSPAPIEGRIDESLIRPVDLPVLLGSHQKLTSATGWRPKVDLAQTLRDVLDDARSRQIAAPAAAPATNGGPINTRGGPEEDNIEQ